MTQPDAARVERGPITEVKRFALGMADLLERQGFTVAAAELRRLHAENEALQNTKHYEAPRGFVPGDFDHGIGADRFRVVRGAFWWHVLIGDSPTEHGKFRSRASAEKMAADLLREFRNGAFVQHEAALTEPVQDPVQDPVQEPVAWKDKIYETLYHQNFGNSIPLYTAPPQRKPEPNSDYERGFVDGMSEQARRSVDKAVNAMTKCKPLAEEEIARLVTNDMVKFARAIERAHGIT